MSGESSRAGQRQRAVAALLLLTTTGCYTTQNVATLSPLDTQYPVSASGQYVDAGGNVVEETGYTVVRPFELEKTVVGPRHDSTETPLELKPELDRLLQESGGDAITDLKVQAVNYDAGSHGSAAGWKIMGWTFGITGGVFLLAGAATTEPRGRDVALPIGGLFAGIGALSFLGAAVAKEPSQWQFKVSGQVVRSKAPPEPAAGETPPAAAPSSAPAAPLAPASSKTP